MSESELNALLRRIADQADENSRVTIEILMQLRGIPEDYRAVIRRLDEMETRMRRLEVGR